MILLKSEMLDLLTDHLLLFEVDLSTLKITFASRPLEVLLGFGVQGELAGKLAESVLPGLLTPDFAAAPTVKSVKLDKVGEILLLPRASTAGRVAVGVVSCPPLVPSPASEAAKGGVP